MLEHAGVVVLASLECLVCARTGDDLDLDFRASEHLQDHPGWETAQESGMFTVQINQFLLAHGPILSQPDDGILQIGHGLGVDSRDGFMDGADQSSATNTSALVGVTGDDVADQLSLLVSHLGSLLDGLPHVVVLVLIVLLLGLDGRAQVHFSVVRSQHGDDDESDTRGENAENRDDSDGGLGHDCGALAEKKNTLDLVGTQVWVSQSGLNGIDSVPKCLELKDSGFLNCDRFIDLGKVLTHVPTVAGFSFCVKSRLTQNNCCANLDHEHTT